MYGLQTKRLRRKEKVIRTQCHLPGIRFQDLGNRVVEVNFHENQITTNGGSLLLSEVDKLIHISERFASFFQDYRNPNLIEHTVLELIRQRVFGIALGYEDLNDHETLRSDPILAIMAGKKDPTGKFRVRERDKRKALAGNLPWIGWRVLKKVCLKKRDTPGTKSKKKR